MLISTSKPVHHCPHVIPSCRWQAQEQSGAYQHFKWNTLQRAVLVQWKITQLKEVWQMTFQKVKIMSRIVHGKQLYSETQNTKVPWLEAVLMLVVLSNDKPWYELTAIHIVWAVFVPNQSQSNNFKSNTSKINNNILSIVLLKSLGVCGLRRDHWNDHWRSTQRHTIIDLPV